MAAMITVAMRVSRGNRAGNRFADGTWGKLAVVWGCQPRQRERAMPRGRSTFTKRQKEQTRQQRQREKAERRSQRKQETPAPGSRDEMAELREHAAAQAAMFNLGTDESSPEAEVQPRITKSD